MPRPTSIPITHGLTCPCCNQPTRRQWHQPAWNPAKPPLSQTDCTNPECEGYYMTLAVEAFFERYGQKAAALLRDNPPAAPDTDG